ncbi:hypothetical protein JKG47_02375 [Acidithiobacillus sp. MC6.1]|jgi:hypothetical protein|uniref:Transcriptional regulator HTH-type FeoC domain-containing protein n=1 Tax=Acidithiobacillus ferrivorans TaxID=160808 RepID=A0A1B9BY20_9PROT|nr:FeoC-like transcriptional regulator [Acidithiobacillus ferrivorans]MBN6739402.1 hypothetical protein [Acidithiobacillus sp. MC6.1]OCB02608.1 hypothetical protein BBC27_12355 [Acidithiobacillus ferrivorans]
MKPLFAVREVLQKQGMASASQIATELKLSVRLVEDMLTYWQRRGTAELVLVGAPKSCGTRCNSGGCGSCSSTSAAPVQAYRWCCDNAGKAAIAIVPIAPLLHGDRNNIDVV